MASPGSTSESFPESNGSVCLAEAETNYSSGMSSPANVAAAAAAVAALQSSQHAEANDLALANPEKLPCKFQRKSPVTVGMKNLTVDNGTSLSPSSAQSSDIVATPNLTHCYLCVKTYDQPKVLACFHTFCKACLEKLVDSPGKIICPLCGAETQLCADQGVDSLLCDYALANLQEQSKSMGDKIRGEDPLQDQCDQPCGQCYAAAAATGTQSSTTTSSFSCTGCKSKESVAVARCFDCSNFLCANCVMAHQFMHCFEGHRVIELSQMSVSDGAGEPEAADRPVKCLQHHQENMHFFCLSCNIPICKECTLKDHPRDTHHFEKISEIGSQQKKYMQKMLEEAHVKQRNFSETFKRLDDAGQRLQIAFHKAQQDIAETSNLLQQMVIEQRQHALKDLENAYHNKQVITLDEVVSWLCFSHIVSRH
ncbi:unnamed protein product [Soboliphyme baturini]|uniref:RING-type domain-containing protein n=1 Tax=Soboliphyme baturini TaxID=241478 RepID=A0A183IEH0_9BILA|nr:unnamed protein product [Soboliphyme baturini]